MRRGLLLNVGVAILLLVGLGTTLSRAAYAPYDDFSNNRLDFKKWQGDPMEFVRMVDDSTGCLVSKISGRSVVRNYTITSPSQDLQSIKVDVTVVETSVDTSTPARAFARIGGIFYNADSASASDSAGDVC
jgi:hypothetical protein